MSDPEDTIPEKYKRAEGVFDKIAQWLVNSPYTLALFAAWTIAVALFGWWLG